MDQMRSPAFTRWQSTRVLPWRKAGYKVVPKNAAKLTWTEFDQFYGDQSLINSMVIYGYIW